MRLPNLNALRMFDAAARHLNFRLAAEEMHLTQGAVAQQIRRLEADLDLVLFERLPRGLGLTDAGRSYHKPIRRALAIIEDATSNLRPDIATVRLSVTPSFATKWLVPRLGRFEALYPDIDLQTEASERNANFKSDGVDLAIRHGRSPFQGGFKSELLSRLQLSAVCSPDYAKTLSPVERIEDFSEHRLIQDSHRYWEELFADCDTQPRHRIMQFNQTSLAMDAAANGRGIALAAKLLIREDLAKGSLVPLWEDDSADQSGYYIVYPEGQKAKPERDAVINWIKSEIA